MSQLPRINSIVIRALLAPLLLTVSAQMLFAPAAQSTEMTPAEVTVPAVWKPVDFQFSYIGFTTAYSCDGLEFRMEQILKAVGAHPDTRVSVTGCPGNGPSDHAFVRITGGLPVPAASATVQSEPAPKEKSRAELLKRLGVKPGFDQDQFPASEKVVDLSRERAAGLQAGDCELMEQLSREVFPKLGLKVLEADQRCFPGQLPITTPRLKVSALIKTPSPDDATKKPKS